MGVGSWLERIQCWWQGHLDLPPRILGRSAQRGTVVVQTECLRCGRDTVEEVTEKSLLDRAARTEGPWGTVPCLICRREVGSEENTSPETWPDIAVCRECDRLWHPD